MVFPDQELLQLVSGQLAGNNTTIEVSTPERIPLFVKDGAVIPMLMKHVDNTRDVYGHPLVPTHGTFG